MADEESKEDKKEQQKDVSEIFLKKKILIGGSEINDNVKKSLFQILNKDNVLLNDNQNGKSIKYNIRTKIKTTKNNKATTFEDFKNKLLNAHNNKGNSNTKNIYKLLNKNNKKKMKKSKLLNLSQRFASQQNNKNKKQKLNDKKENENDKNEKDKLWIPEAPKGLREYDPFGIIKGRGDGKGKIQISLELVPEKDMHDYPAGLGRDEPNINPHLPEPVGRVKWSIFHPWDALRNILGDKLLSKICCIFCCLILVSFIILILPNLFSTFVANLIL
eukprot:336826_1